MHVTGPKEDLSQRMLAGVNIDYVSFDLDESR